MANRLGIDLGTSTTVAVLAGPAATRPLLFDASPLLSSAVFAGASGELLTGLDAERAAVARPAGLEANPKRRVDDGTVWLGEREYLVADVLAAVLHRVHGEACRVAGGPIDEVVLTHPAAWGRTRLGVLADAAARAGLPDPGLVPEPVAAAAYFATVRDLPPGRCVVVYDLGAGTFDVSVVRSGPSASLPGLYSTSPGLHGSSPGLSGSSSGRPGSSSGPSGFEVVAADGLADLGGLDLDAAVVAHARALTTAATAAWGRLDWPQSPDDQQARRSLWTGARAAKEQLTRHATAELHLPLVGSEVLLTREEFEASARPLLDRTVALTVKVLRDAAVAPDSIAGVFLVGGSSRIPLAATLLHRALRIAPTIVDQPELVVAEGSLLAPVSVATDAPPTDPRPIPAVPVPEPVAVASVPALAPVSLAPAVPVSAAPVASTPAPVSASPGPAPVSAAPAPAAAPVPPRPESTVEVPAGRSRRGRIVVAALVVVALVVGGVFAFRRLTGGPVVAELQDGSSPVHALAFSPDGARLVTAAQDGKVRFWNMSSHAADGSPIDTGTALAAVAYSPDGKQIAAAGQDGRIRVWDAATRAEHSPAIQPSRTFAVDALAFDKDSKTLAVGGAGGIGITYDLATGRQTAELDALAPGTVRSLAFDPAEANRLVMGGDQPVIVRYGAGAAAEPVVTVTKHSGSIKAVAVSQDGSAASGGTDGAVLFWPDQAGIAATRLTGHTGAVNAVAFDQSGNRLASGGEDGAVRIWNTSSRAEVGSPYEQAHSPIEALAYRPGEPSTLATASRDGVVRLWHLA